MKCTPFRVYREKPFLLETNVKLVDYAVTDQHISALSLRTSFSSVIRRT